MKIYRITDLAGTWWAEIGTDNMKTQDDQTICQLRSKYSTNAINNTDIATEIVALGVWNQVGKRFTEVELKQLCINNNFNLVMYYEGDSPTTKGTALVLQATPTFDPVAGAVPWGTTITIASSGADSINYTLDGSIPTAESADQSEDACVVDEDEMIVRAIAFKSDKFKSLIGQAIYTQALAAAPTNAVLAVGSAQPVGGVVNVAIPAAGATDNTGKVTGWVATTADKVKFTVTNAANTTSTLTINGAAYISGADYTITAAETITVVLTTVRENYKTTVRTFTIDVVAAE